MDSIIKKRDAAFDVARAICMLWIISCWHVFDYIEYPEWIKGEMKSITICVLACFTFISGYFVGKKKIDILEFYNARFNRFYLLFFVSSSILLIGGWFESIWQFFFTLTGLSNFILPQAKTLWYMSMLLLFYILTPFLLMRKGYSQIVLGVCLSLSLYLLYLFNMADRRTPFYFVFYFFGIVTPFTMTQKIRDFKYLLQICLVSVIFLIIYRYYIGVFDNVFIAGVGVFSIISISLYVAKNLHKRILDVFYYISYSSLCAYLFHRIFFKFFKIVFSNSDGFIPLMCIPVIVVVIMIMSYFIQYIYDSYVLPILNKKSYDSRF